MSSHEYPTTSEGSPVSPYRPLRYQAGDRPDGEDDGEEGGSGSASNTNNNNHLITMRGPVKRPRQACTNCRALKTRCLPYGSGGMKSKDTCSRCAKYGLQCDYERKPRGNPRNSIDENASAPLAPTHVPAPGAPTAGPSSSRPTLSRTESRDSQPDPVRSLSDFSAFDDTLGSIDESRGLELTGVGMDKVDYAFMAGSTNDEGIGTIGPGWSGFHIPQHVQSYQRIRGLSGPEPTLPQLPSIPPTNVPPKSLLTLTNDNNNTNNSHILPPPTTAFLNLSNPPVPVPLPSQPSLLFSLATRKPTMPHPSPFVLDPASVSAPASTSASTSAASGSGSRSGLSPYFTSEFAMTSSSARSSTSTLDLSQQLPPIQDQFQLQTQSQIEIKAKSQMQMQMQTQTQAQYFIPSSRPGSPPRPLLKRTRRKPDISTLITDHLEPWLGRDDSRSRSPSPSISSRSRRGKEHEDDPEDPVNFAVQDRGRPVLSTRTSIKNKPKTQMTVHPVDLGIISEGEAHYLFNQFVHHLSPVIAAFDHEYTTYERAHSSPALFTSILFASARFFRPDVSPALRSHAEVLVNRAVTEGTFDLPTIQALLVLAYWKLPKDGTAYIKLGMAIRAACQLRLWKKRKGPLPTDEAEARAVLDRERTWIGLDFAYSHIFDQPFMVPQTELQFTDAAEWAFEHEHLNISVDWYLAWHGCIHMPLDTVSKVRVGTETDVQPQANSNSDSTDNAPDVKLMTLTQRWIDGPYLTARYKQLTLIVTLMSILNIRSVAVQLDPSESSRNALMCCAEDLADRLTVLARDGVLPYWSETAGTGISLAGAMLYKSKAEYTKAELDRILLLLPRFVEICQTSYGAGEDHALHYIQRFYRRLIGVFQKLKEGVSVGVGVGSEAGGDKMVDVVQPDTQNGMSLLTNQPAQAPWDQLMGFSTEFDPQWSMLWGLGGTDVTMP